MRNGKTIILGIIITIIGVIFLGNNLDCWNVDVFFDGWWTLFIIIPSLIGLFKRETFTQSLIGLIIGALFLSASQDIIEWQLIGKIIIPSLIIIFGLTLMFKTNKQPRVNTKNNFQEYTGIFAGTEEKINGDFSNSSCLSVFGSVNLDLTEANIKEDITIDCVTVFGGIELIVPDNVTVKTSGTPIFGGIENKVKHKREDKTDKQITIYVNYVCIFAGIEIK